MFKKNQGSNESFWDTMSKVKQTAQISTVALVVLLLAAAPGLQAMQMSGNLDTGHIPAVHECCGCCCCQAAQADESGASGQEEHTCACRVDDSSPVPELSLEANPSQQVKVDAEVQTEELTGVGADVVSPVSDIYGIDIPLANSPPLFVLHSSYII